MQFRIVEEGTEGATLFKVQEKGWFFWHDWKTISFSGNDGGGVHITSIRWFNSQEEARQAIADAIKNYLNRPKKINRIVWTGDKVQDVE